MKNPKTALILFSLLLNAFYCMTQSYSSYPLKDYQTPDIRRNSLEMKLYGKFEAQKDEKHLLDVIQVSSFHAYKNTRKKISDFYSNISIREKNASNMDDYDKYQTFTGQVLVEYEERYYITPKFFLNYGAGVLGYVSPTREVRSKYDNGSSIDVNYKNTYSNVAENVTLGVGTGRIEIVTDARHALYIIEALEKEGRLKRHLSESEIFRLAQLISSVKNKRFLDARLHRMDEISRVDSFLIAGDYLERPDATYFTTLYDMWMYGDLFERKSGHEVSLTSKFKHSNVRSTSHQEGVKINNYRSTDNDYDITAIFRYEKPFRIAWQHSFEASINHNNRNESGNADNFKITSLPIEYKLGYYPNTRTHLQFGIRETLTKHTRVNNHSTNSNEVIVNNESRYLHSNLFINLNYYFSPNLLFSLEGSALHNFGKYKVWTNKPSDGYPLYNDKQKNWNTNLEFNLTYKLF